MTDFYHRAMRQMITTQIKLSWDRQGYGSAYIADRIRLKDTEFELGNNNPKLKFGNNDAEELKSGRDSQRYYEN